MLLLSSLPLSLSLSLSLFLSLSPPVVNIGLERSDYTAGESDGQVSVCAELNGALSRPISVSLSTPIGSGTAQGTHADSCLNQIPETHKIIDVVNLMFVYS